MRIAGTKRKLIALAFLAGIAALAWFTLDAGKVRLLVLVILGGFAIRVALTAGMRRDDVDVEEGRQGL
jgi:hypothetical protein